MDPDELIQFDVRAESFFELSNELPPKLFSLSLDGSALLVLDTKNDLGMFDEKTEKVWGCHLESTIEQLKVSRKGDLFTTIDTDGVLTCYSTHSSEKERTEFFELQKGERVIDKESAWTMSPGSHHPINPLGLLTVNTLGNGIGLMGLDGCIHFLDEHGSHCFESPVSGRAYRRQKTQRYRHQSQEKLQNPFSYLPLAGSSPRTRKGHHAH